MATHLVDLLPGICALAEPTHKTDLTEVAALVGLSPSRAQRVIAEAIGESPKRYEQRTRLELAAVLLISSDARVIDVAHRSGFARHETFTRAFTARFGASPTEWRSARRHRFVGRQTNHAISTSRCMTLYRRPLYRKEPSMPYDITTRTVESIPVLFQAHRVAHEQIGDILAQALPAVFGYVMENGLAPAGHPYVRYTGMTHAFCDIEAGIPLVEAPTEPPGEEAGIQTGELPAGLVATTIHTGPYEGLADAYKALEQWAVESEHDAAGSPWEVYLTDPGEVPDPAEWQTEVFLPLA